MHAEKILGSQPMAGALKRKASSPFGAGTSSFKAMIDNAREASHAKHAGPLAGLNAPHKLKALSESDVYHGHHSTPTTQHSLHALKASDRVAHRSSKIEQSQHEKLTRQAKKLVAQTFYGTMLKQMRQSPFKSEVFSGGHGGDAYSALYDQQLSEHMTKGSNKLVRSLVRQLETKANAKNAPAANTPASTALEK